MFKRTMSVFAVLSFLACTNNPSSSTSPISATEQWGITVPGNSSARADIDINRHENNTYSCTGEWVYRFYGYDITCKIMIGAVTKDTSFLKFNCSGTASYPPDSTGYVESSPFTLEMSGRFLGGTASGQWEISFSDTVWDAWAPEPGQFSGTRKSGEGVTD